MSKQELTVEQMIEKFNVSQAQIQKKQEDLEKAIEAKSDALVLKQLQDDIKELSKDRMAMTDILIKQGAMLEKLQKPTKQVEGNFSSIVEKSLTDNKDKIKALKEGKIKKFEINIDLKTVNDSNISNSTAGLRVPGIGELPYRRAVMEPLFQSGSFGADSGGNVRYVDQNSITDNSDWIANCSAIPESDIDWIERNLEAKKVGHHIPVCVDTMENYSFVESEVRTVLMRLLDHKIDEALLLGDGTGNNVSGVDSFAPDWAAGSFALAVDTPNVYDVISTGVTQISVAGQDNFFVPNVTVMNELDIEKMRLTKDANGNTLINPFHDFNSQTIRGTRIVSSPIVPANQLYIGDFSYGTVYTLRGITLEFTDSHAENFLSDIIVIKATARKQLLVRNVHTGAFLHVPSISQAITDLTKP